MKDESYSWEELGNRIRASRRIRGISQEEVAEALGITVSRLRDFEYGRRVMTVDLLVRLAQVLDVSTDFLTTGRQSGSLRAGGVTFGSGGRLTGEDLARLVGVGAVPGSSFFREPVNHLIRFHFAKKDETLLNALNRLESLRAKIPSRKRN